MGLSPLLTFEKEIAFSQMANLRTQSSFTTSTLKRYNFVYFLTNIYIKHILSQILLINMSLYILNGV